MDPNQDAPLAPAGDGGDAQPRSRGRGRGRGRARRDDGAAPGAGQADAPGADGGRGVRPRRRRRGPRADGGDAAGEGGDAPRRRRRRARRDDGPPPPRDDTPFELDPSGVTACRRFEDVDQAVEVVKANLKDGMELRGDGVLSVYFAAQIVAKARSTGARIAVRPYRGEGFNDVHFQIVVLDKDPAPVGEDQFMRAGSQTRPGSCAGAVANRIREGKTVGLSMFGRNAVLRGCKALALAHEYLGRVSPNNTAPQDLLIFPEFCEPLSERSTARGVRCVVVTQPGAPPAGTLAIAPSGGAGAGGAQ